MNFRFDLTINTRTIFVIHYNIPHITCMKKSLPFLLFTFCCLLVDAQDAPQKWFTNLDQAKAQAAANKQTILMVFAGSDWCRPCIKFKKDILLSDQFQQATKDDFVILYLDFPARKKNRLADEQRSHNEALAERFNQSGAFPKILLMNTNEEILLHATYKEHSPQAFLQQFNTYLTQKQ